MGDNDLLLLIPSRYFSSYKTIRNLAKGNGERVQEKSKTPFMTIC